MPKVLIFTPDKLIRGGVSNYYAVAEPYFTGSIKCISFNKFRFKGLLKPISNCLNFVVAFYRVIYYRPVTVVVNPSLGVSPIFRDGLLIYLCRFFKLTTVVFWRGWNPTKERIFDNKFVKYIFDLLVRTADRHIVLNSYVANLLAESGVSPRKICLSTTLVDDGFFDFGARLHRSKFSILFLSRVERYKGVYEAYETFKLLARKYDVELRIAGVGSELENLKKMVIKEKISGVEFLGFVDGDVKKDTFLQSDCYLFPSYSEGMPNSVLEAMASGLPVITRPVGAIADFFEPEKMGFLIEGLDPVDFSFNIARLIRDRDLSLKISEYNKNYAREHFIASKVVRNLETLLIG
jgi:glycosyltransferase involved in cell wall biosynthesis